MKWSDVPFTINTEKGHTIARVAEAQAAWRSELAVDMAQRITRSGGLLGAVTIEVRQAASGLLVCTIEGGGVSDYGPAWDGLPHER